MAGGWLPGQPPPLKEDRNLNADIERYLSQSLQDLERQRPQVTTPAVIRLQGVIEGLRVGQSITEQEAENWMARVRLVTRESRRQVAVPSGPSQAAPLPPNEPPARFIRLVARDTGEVEF